MTPDDVYALVDERTRGTQSMLAVLTYALCVLCVLVVVQIVAKLVIWAKVIRLLREVKVLVRIAETHGNLNDQQAARVESVVAQATEVRRAGRPGPGMEDHVIEEIRKIPEQTADKTAARAAEAEVRHDRKLETIHMLVNSSYTTQLKLTALALRRVADLTQHPSDVKAAEQAEHMYEEHERELKAGENGKAAAGKEGGEPPAASGCAHAVAVLLVGAVVLGMSANRADAADDMRREGEARALAWVAAGQPDGTPR